MTTPTILPHGEFVQLDENLWILEGTLPMKVPLPRTMTVFRLRDGGLWIHSAIALNEKTRDKLESFGAPKVLVVPSTMHRLDAPKYKKLYPSIKVVCPEASRKKVQEKVPVDASCETEFQGSEVIAHVMPGAKPIELAYELPLKSGGKALVINDVLVNVTKTNGLFGSLLGLIGRTGAFRSPPSNKLILLDDRAKFKGWLETQSKRSDIKIVTVSHGDPVTSQVAAKFAAAAEQV